MASVSIDIADKTTLDEINSKVSTLISNLIPKFYHFQTAETVPAAAAGTAKTILNVEGQGYIHSLRIRGNPSPSTGSAYIKIFLDDSVEAAFTSDWGSVSLPTALYASNSNGLVLASIPNVNTNFGDFVVNIPFQSKFKVEICGDSGVEYTYTPNISYILY